MRKKTFLLQSVWIVAGGVFLAARFQKNVVFMLDLFIFILTYVEMMVYSNHKLRKNNQKWKTHT